MATIALHSASTGLSALSTSLDVIANNLANSNTTGFKASRTNFEDLVYQELAQPGVENQNGDRRPIGLYVGLGTKVSGTQLDFSLGAPEPTKKPLDLYIEGDGFFAVEVEDDIAGGIAYTRQGNFVTNEEGDLVLANSEGRRLEPNITIPEGASSITIRRDGSVSVILPGETEETPVGVIELSTFINPAGLRQLGEGLFGISSASGSPSRGDPLTGNRGGIQQGALEASNVDPVIELVKLIKTQRAFEMNSQVIQAADETLQEISNLRRF